MADASDILTIYDRVGAVFSQALPALTRRVIIRVDGTAAVTMKGWLFGTAFHLPLDEPYAFTGRDLGGRTLYFTTPSGEHVYIACEHDPAL